MSAASCVLPCLLLIDNRRFERTQIMPIDKMDELLREVKETRKALDGAPKTITGEQFRQLNDNVLAIGASVNKLDEEWRLENKAVKLAIGNLDERVTKIERRPVAISVAPRGFSPMPRRYDLSPSIHPGKVDLEPIEKRLVEVEQTNEAMAEELALVMGERDAAKQQERFAQERQAAIKQYADDKEREKEKLEKDKLDQQQRSEKKLRNVYLAVKILGGALAAIVTAEGIFRIFAH